MKIETLLSFLEGNFTGSPRDPGVRLQATDLFFTDVLCAPQIPFKKQGIWSQMMLGELRSIYLKNLVLDYDKRRVNKHFCMKKKKEYSVNTIIIFVLFSEFFVHLRIN